MPKRSIDKKTIKGHMVFILIVLLGTITRVIMDTEGDRNVTIFAIILSLPVIFGVSLINQFIIDLVNSFNAKWTILNYCSPAIFLLLLILIVRVPIETFDIIALPILILAADLSMFAILYKSAETHSR